MAATKAVRALPAEAPPSTSSADRPTHGRPLASASPCTLLRPIRRPVKEPGPTVTAKASRRGRRDAEAAQEARRTAGSSQRECPSRRSDPRLAERPLPRRRPPRCPEGSWCRRREGARASLYSTFAGPGEHAGWREPRTRVPPLSSSALAQTPAMQQYHRMKAEHPDALLFFRMGDFYELFFEDAVVAAPALEIALTSRSKDRDGNPVPMCGVPHHAVAAYVAKLVKQGFRVALCEQMEDPRTAKGVVKREVVRVITPGTQLEAGGARGRRDILGGGARARAESASASPGSSRPPASSWPPSGTAPTASSGCATRSAPAGPREILLPPRRRAAGLALRPGAARGRHPAGPRRGPRASTSTRPTRAARPLRRVDPRGLRLRGAAAAPPPPPAPPCATSARRRSGTSRHVTALRHPRGAGRAHPSTRSRAATSSWSRAWPTAAGAARCSTCSTRRGRPWARGCCATGSCGRWSSSSAIQDRLDAVEELAFRALERGGAARGAGARAGPRPDPGPRGARAPRARATSPRSRRLVRALPAAAEALGRVRGAAGAAAGQGRSIPPLDLADEIERTIVDEPPALAREGGFVRDGVDAELDSLRETSRGGRATIAAIEERERQRTGISLAQGPLQPRLRLLHRGQQVEPGARAGRTTSASRRSPAASAS